MSQFSDFLSENGFSNADVVARSKAIETLSTKERAVMVQRANARRTKKSYEEAEAGKPAALGRGVSERTIKLASEGTPVTRTARKKILRAVNSLLASAKKDAVETKILFADVKSRNDVKKAD